MNFYSGAFPANTSNSLSSVLDMRQVDGNKDKLKVKNSVGASDMALTLDGPLSKNTTFIASARRSYLQFLFAALKLPFLPTYNDFQLKTRTMIDDKNEISFIGLGAIDQSKLNLDANETPDQRYILSYLPVNNQWNYTVGAVYKHYRSKGYDTYVLSRNYLNNASYKYPDNNESLLRSFNYKSAEIENKFRYEHVTTLKNNLKINYGAGLAFAKYFNNTMNTIYSESGSTIFEYKTNADMFHYGAFVQASKPLLKSRLTTSVGLRTDASTYSSEMNSPLKHISPRLSLSYALTDKLSINMNTGRYYQRPPYTALGYKDNNGNFVNKVNGITYIASNHYVTGIEFQPDKESMISVEGFYKIYSKYPFSIVDSVPLATKGAGFGTVGDESLVPLSKGHSYGVEILGRWQNLFGISTVFSYTYVRSEFKDLRAGHTNEYIPTSWDNRHIINLTATRTFKGNWYIGFKWRFVGGAPYTPYDIDKSEIKAAWDAQGKAYLDYSKFNSLRLRAFHQLDIRVDKQYYFNKWSLNLYMDIQNVYNFKAEEPPTIVRRSFIEPGYNDVYTENSVEKYELVELASDGSGTILPTIGIIFEF